MKYNRVRKLPPVMHMQAATIFTSCSREPETLTRFEWYAVVHTIDTAESYIITTILPVLCVTSCVSRLCNDVSANNLHVNAHTHVHTQRIRPKYGPITDSIQLPPRSRLRECRLNVDPNLFRDFGLLEIE